MHTHRRSLECDVCKKLTAVLRVGDVHHPVWRFLEKRLGAAIAWHLQIFSIVLSVRKRSEVGKLTEVGLGGSELD